MRRETKISVEEIDETIDKAKDNYSKDSTKYIIGFLLMFTVIVIYLLIPKTFWLIPSSFTKEKIDTRKDPIIINNEVNINNSNNIRKNSTNGALIKYKSIKDGEIYYLLPLAKYTISARIKEKNRFFYTPWEIDNVVIVDYGLAWGDMAQDYYYKRFYGDIKQTNKGRNIIFNFKDKDFDSLLYKLDYMSTHTSHTQAIPSNKNVKKALLTAKEGQTIKMEGYLVDVFNKNYRRFAMSSNSFSDINETSRGYGKGGGASEVMYVTKIQIGNKIFK